MKNTTIAVLPFVNISANAGNEYFSDGITEEIINALSKINNLKVTSRTSSFFFKNKNIPIKEVAKVLNVSAILEGSVRLSGDTVRITAQLIEAEEDFHFWSETWDRKLENIFEIQDEISLLIAERLRENFGHLKIQDHLVEKQIESVDAYGFFLKALFHFRKWNPDDMHTAISLYEKALELDPHHSQSMTGLADCYGFMATTGFVSAQEGYGKAIQLTNAALALNDQSPAVHYQLANIAFFNLSNYQESIQLATRAIELNPNFAEARRHLSFMFILSGEKEKSWEHLEVALSIDPLSQETWFYEAYFHYMLGDFAIALAQLDRCLQYNSKNLPARSMKNFCLLKLGRWDEVLDYFIIKPSEFINPLDELGLTTLAYILKGDSENETKYRSQLVDQAMRVDGFTANSYLFLAYVLSGEIDMAFEWLRQAIEKKTPLVHFYFADPLAKSIKNDHRYLEIHQILFWNNTSTNEFSDKKKEFLDAGTVEEYSSRLLNHIHNRKPYLDPAISLRSLAEQVNIHPNQLSWLINESMGKNFNEFINHYRVDAFKELSKDPTKAHITLIGLAYESGFNSKTVFNTYFKKETGMTPKEFLKN